MRRVVVLLVVAVVGFGVTAEAQEYPAGEIFGGFSIYDAGSSNMYGWQASGAANMSEHLGLVADFGGQYTDVAGIGISSHEFLFGPRLRTSRSTLNGFAHSLFGFQTTGAAGLSSTNFTMGFGGGLDIITDSGWGVRAIQFDWLPTKASGSWFNDQYRLGFGVIMPIGN